MMKTTIFVAFCAVLCATVVLGQSNNYTWGYLETNNSLVYREIVKASSGTLQIQRGNVTFPVKGAVNYRPITFMRLSDQYTNGNGGSATIGAGGVGFNNVTLELKSQRGHGYNFIVEIYVR